MILVNDQKMVYQENLLIHLIQYNHYHLHLFHQINHINHYYPKIFLVF